VENYELDKEDEFFKQKERLNVRSKMNGLNRSENMKKQKKTTSMTTSL